ncbi:hypothetical protein HBI82_135910 [Parastagonospora nodorum]|nr:hypothetical protein HBI82_135910 [Parastagonospora nodorum]
MSNCASAADHAHALINSQSRGTILVMVAWFLASLLALCTVFRLICRCRSHYAPSLSIADDIVIVAASLCGLGVTIVISTAVDSGLGKTGCLLSWGQLEDIQIRIFASTILFVLVLSISKCSLLMFLHRVANNTLQRVGIMTIGVVVLIWMLGVLTGIIFECEMPRPWEIWTGKCIPMVPFWITTTAIDITIDLTLLILSTHMIWLKPLTTHQKTTATAILSLRVLLILSSAIRLAYLSPFFSPTDPTLTSTPYTILSQIQSTLSILLSCALILPPLTGLTTSSPPHHRHAKHWSGSTIGTPYEAYQPADPFSSRTCIVAQAPAHVPTRAHDEDFILPERVRVPPRRPEPPCERDRPDLSMFRKTTVLRECRSMPSVGKGMV